MLSIIISSITCNYIVKQIYCFLYKRKGIERTDRNHPRSWRGIDVWRHRSETPISQSKSKYCFLRQILWLKKLLFLDFFLTNFFLRQICLRVLTEACRGAWPSCPAAPWRCTSAPSAVAPCPCWGAVWWCSGAATPTCGMTAAPEGGKWFWKKFHSYDQKVPINYILLTFKV